MRRIRFRYNKYSPGVFYIMVVLGVTLGLLILYEFIIFSGIAEGPEQGPAYFREHPKHAVVLIFALIPVAMLLPVWIAKKWWSRTEEEAKIELYEEQILAPKHSFYEQRLCQQSVKEIAFDAKNILP